MSELKQERTALESMTLELKDLRLNMKTIQMTYDKKLEERNNYINNSDIKHKLNGFIYVTKSKYPDHYVIGSCSIISTINDIEYLYTREIENSSIVVELLTLLLSKSIIVLVNDYIKKDEAENMKQDQRD